MFLGTIGQGAEMPTPGVQSQMLGKSGGNKFQGEFYTDYETNGMIGENIIDNVPAKFLYDPVTNPGGTIRRAQQRDAEVPRQQHQRRRPDQEGQGVVVLLVPQPEDLGRPAELHRPDRQDLSTPSCGTRRARSTYQINQNNKLIGYYQWGQKVQPNRLPQSALNYTYARRHAEADLGQLDLQG